MQTRDRPADSRARKLRSPKARGRDHDAAGVHETTFECLDRGGIYRMGHAEIVGMNDQEFRITRVSESFGDRFRRFLTADFNERKTSTRITRAASNQMFVSWRRE